MAYLRGYLTPGKPQGIYSALRKELVLDAVHNELSGEDFYTSSIMSATLVDKVEENQRQRILDRAVDHLERAAAFREHFGHRKKSRKKRSSRAVLSEGKHLMELYRTLKRSGVLRKLMDG